LRLAALDVLSEQQKLTLLDFFRRAVACFKRLLIQRLNVMSDNVRVNVAKVFGHACFTVKFQAVPNCP
jgi:hypothetical protein